MDHLFGELSDNETLCYSLLENEVSSFLVDIDNPLVENETVDFSLSTYSACNINVEINDLFPIINIELYLNANILNTEDVINVTDQESVELLNTSLCSHISSIFSDYLYKTSTEYNTDINHFYKIARQKFLNITNFNNYNWNEKYKNAEFNIDINLNMSLNVVQNM